MPKMIVRLLHIAAAAGAVLLLWSGAEAARAASVSFAVDPTTIDTNMDGFITGSEFEPVGSDGTVFALVPTNNLVGADRFLLNATNGLQFGGGGGSTLSFDFTPSADIQLESYTIGGGFILSDPVFDVREGATTLSASNGATASGPFASGPLSLSGGTTYSFVATTTGAAVQSWMAAWTYTTVPEPMLGLLLVGAGLALGSVRGRRHG